MWLTSSLSTVLTPTAIALGNFDGIHRGHQKVIESIFEAAAAGGCYPSVVTFYPHPQEYFTGQRRQLLTPIDEKVQQLETLGVTQLVTLPFNQDIAQLSPQEFVEKILIEHLQTQWVSVGEDFRFGRGRSGTVADLKAIASNFNVQVNIVSLQTCAEGRISSSQIRQALQEGNIEQANRLLGRPYSLTGKVVYGQQLGRTIGFPTANLQLPSEKFLPRQGVYSVQALGSELGESPLTGVMNIGTRPTVDGTQQTIEIHLLDWSGDLYDQNLTVNLVEFIRPEQKFNSLDELKAQIQVDCEKVRHLISYPASALS